MANHNLSIRLIISTLLMHSVAAEAEITKTITVDAKGPADFKSVQDAIDSVPEQNNQWIKIRIKAGTYSEKVTIPRKKGYLMLEGDGANITIISWSDYDNITSYDYYPIGRNSLSVPSKDSATLGVWEENVVLKDLGIQNNYGNGHHMGKAVAVTLAVDKIAVYGCSFTGIQDTVRDRYGRHYLKNCYIEGAVDFIWGSGQSLYENCNICTVTGDRKSAGWVTAHGRNKEDSSGFVFKGCTVGGAAKTYLGRAWKPYARVIFFQTYMGSIVVPGGWDNNHFDANLSTFVERNNSGPGANLNGRVPWIRHFSEKELIPFVSRSFVDDGWISQQPM